MKVLYISHIYVVEQNRQKIKIIQNKYRIDTLIVTPLRWKNILIKNFDASSNKKEKNICYLDVYKQGNLKQYIYKNLITVLKKFMPDIIHIDEEPWFRSAFQVVLYSKIFLNPKPKIVIFSWENIERRLKIHYRLIEKFNIKNSSAIITGNKEAKERILRRKPICPVYVSPNLGVNLDDYNFKKTPSSKIRIGYIGRLVPEKGILLLLNAFKKLPFKNKHLSITGDGPLRDEIKKFITQHNLNNLVKLNPPVPHNRVPILFKELDIFVLASFSTKQWKEQFGHTLIEAMAGKTAVIGSNSGAIPEVIHNAGLIFREKDEKDLYSKLFTLSVNKKLQKKLVERAYLRVKKYYTNEILAKETIKIYNEIL